MPASSADLDQVLDVVHRVFGADRASLNGDTTADDVDGWDSVSHANLILELETAFGIALSFEATIALANLRELADHIAEASGAADGAVAPEIAAPPSAVVEVAPFDDAKRPLIVFGNCQAEAIANCLRNHPALGGREVHVLLSFQMPGQEPPSLPAELYGRCGLLWEQATPLVRFPFCASLPADCRIRTFPSIDFNLLWPLNAPEPRNHSQEGFPFGPFSYGDRVINEIVAQGLAGEAAWAAYVARSTAAMPNLRRLADIEYNRWASLERDLDVKLADQMFRRFKSERLFSTFNHPTPDMLCHVGTELLRASGLGMDKSYDELFREVRGLFTWAFGRDYEAPVHPDVAAAFDLQWWSPTLLYNWHNQPRSAEDFIRAQIDWSLSKPSRSPVVESFNEESVAVADTPPAEAALVAEPPEAIAQPTEVPAQPPAAVAEPTEAIAEPTEVPAQPPAAVAESMEVFAEPTDVLAQPPAAVAEATQAIADPMEAEIKEAVAGPDAAPEPVAATAALADAAPAEAPEAITPQGKLVIVDQNALAVGGHYHAYTQCVALAALGMGLDVHVLHNRKFNGRWQPDEIKAIPAFDYSWSEAEGRWQTSWSSGNIAYDFAAATRDLDLGPLDHVFFSTVGYTELLNVLRFLIEDVGTTSSPHFHILLRYDPEILRSRIMEFVEHFARVKRSPVLRDRVHFHTDTQGLTESFTDLLDIPFTTLPIPFLQQPLRDAMRLRPARAADAPLVVTYLGDARLEKNYNLIPDAVAYLYEDYVRTNRVRFVIQSNFNVPGGEPGILSSTQRLGQYLPDQVTLLAEPLAADEYYRTLAEADAVIIPYDALRYRLRSSGILIEAMAAGKPVVTTAGSWMATKVDAADAVLLEPGAALGPAIERLLLDYPRYSARAAARSASAMLESSGEAFVRAMLSSATPAASVAPATPAGADAIPRILYVLDGDVLVLRNGAGVTAMTQLAYLRDAGYRVAALFLLNKQLDDPAGIEAWTRELKERVASFDFEAFFIAVPSRLSLATLAQQSRRERFDFSIINDVEAAAHREVSIELARYMAASKFDAVWLNYAVNFPLLESLGLGGVPVICETHDIQSFQKAIYGKRRIDERDLRLEFDLLSRCSSLVSVSATETAYILARLPNMKIATTGIFPVVSKSPLRSLAGPKSIGEVVSSCGPHDVEYQWEQAWACQRTDKILRLQSLETLDLVFVSSNHLANVSGLRWFLDSIYIPYLAPLGVSLAVAGSICELPDWPQHERLFFVGRVRELAPLYGACKLVVLPILEGAGIAVKTQEALNHGRPVVATAVATRGLPAGCDGVVEANEPGVFAASVLDLLKSDEKRRRLGRAAYEAARAMASPKRYADILNPVFADILGSRALPVRRDDEQVIGPTASLEWCDLVRHANRAVRGWLDDQPVEYYSLKEFAAHPRDEVRDILGSLLDELVAKRSAYACSTEADMLRKIVLRRRSDCRQALDLMMLQLDAHEGAAPTALHETRELQVAVTARAPVHLMVFADAAATLALPDELPVGFAAPREFGVGDAVGYEATREPDPAAPSDLVVIHMAPAAGFGEHAAIIVSQRFDLRRPGSHAGLPIVTVGTQHNGADQTPGGNLTIRLPPSLCNAASCGFVDIAFQQQPDRLDVRSDQQAIAEVATLRRPDAFVHRYRLAGNMTSLDVHAVGAQVATAEVRHHIVLGGGAPEQGLAVHDAVHGYEAVAEPEGVEPEGAAFAGAEPSDGKPAGAKPPLPVLDGNAKPLSGLARSFSMIKGWLT